MTTHEMKTDPEPFEAMWRGDKTAEFRRDDRTPRYEVGDHVRSREFDRETQAYSGREMVFLVSDVRRAGPYGIPEGYAMLSASQIKLYPKDRPR